MQPVQMRWAARAIVALWGCWWTFFAFAATLSEGGAWQKGLLPMGLAALIFVGSSLLAWRWEAAGSVLLVTEGLMVCLAYPIGFLHAGSINTMLVVLLTLAAPPIIAGLLFFGSWWRRRRPTSD